MSFGPFYRSIGAHNAGEYEKVTTSMEVWGSEARCLAGGLRVQAVPLDRAGHGEGYNFKTYVQPKESLGFPLNGPPMVREVYWEEGHPGVEYRDSGRYVCIPVFDVRLGRS
jgi:hypothetical protein